MRYLAVIQLTLKHVLQERIEFFDVALARTNQVWCTDITYIPIVRGMINAEKDAAEFPIKKTTVVVLTRGSTSEFLIQPQWITL